MVLLFATDTSSEPYVVPVFFDFAVPLTVAAPPQVPEPQPRIVNIRFDDSVREIDLHIFRDRYWRMVGFPRDYFDIGREDGDRNEVVTLRLKEGYTQLGTARYTWHIQSGMQRVLIVVEVTMAHTFSVTRPHAILERENNFEQIVHIRRRGYGDIANRGYTWNTFSGHTIEVVASVQGKANRPSVNGVQIPDVGEPEDTIYDTVRIRFTGVPENMQAGTSHIGTITFTTVSNANVTATTRIYRNIDLWYNLTGQDNRPAPNGTNTNWTISKAQGATNPVYSNQTATWKYLTVNYDGANANPNSGFNVRGNHAAALSGDMLSLSSGSLTWSQVRAANGINVSASSASTRLQIFTELTLQFNNYEQRYETSPTTTTTRVIVPTAITVRFEIRHPHFFRVSDTYLQWDNNWEQHHWLVTNPDAVISAASVQVAGQIGGNTLTWSNVTSGSGDFLMRFSDGTAQTVDDKQLDVYTVTAVSRVPDSFALGTWLSSPNREDQKSFKVCVCYLQRTRNEIVPLMLSGTQEEDILGRQVGSDFAIIPSAGWSGVVPRVFDRNNRNDFISAQLTGGRRKLRDPQTFGNRSQTCSFIVEFDQIYIIRSWSYSVQGIGNLACGFLIEGQLEGFHGTDEWGIMSAVSEFDSASSLPAEEATITIDYVTVTPRPWSRLRITVTQVRTGSNGSSSKTHEQVSGTFKVGQFQFYSGYPVLGRISGTAADDQTAPQLHTREHVRFIAPETTHTVAPISSGHLRQIREDTDRGIRPADFYASGQPHTHWHYQLVNPTATGPATFAATLAYMGILLEGVDAETTPLARLIGVRYDTGTVADYSTAGALAIETSNLPRSERAALANVHNFDQRPERRLVISGWRHLGLGQTHLDGINSSLDIHSSNQAIADAARAAYTAFALAAQKIVFGADQWSKRPDDFDSVVAEGTMVLRVDTVQRDFRLVLRVDGEWINIGQDIILDAGSNIFNRDTVANAWWAAFGIAEPRPDRIAITMPSDNRRWVHEDGQWVDRGDYSFDGYKGRQHYRNVEISAVRSLRISIPGLADTASYINGGLDQILALVGNLQIFEQFRSPDPSSPGVDVTYRDIRVTVAGTTRSVKYGDTLFVTSNTESLTVAVDGATVNGELVGSSIPIFVQTVSSGSGGWTTRSVARNSTSWTQLDASGTVVALESQFTATTVTLFYRTVIPGQADATNVRHVPFFSFLVLRPNT